MAIQPDNMIVVGGGFAATLGGRMDFGLARFDNSGAIDAVFGSYGVSAQDPGGRPRARSLPWRSSLGTASGDRQGRTGQGQTLNINFWKVNIQSLTLAVPSICTWHGSGRHDRL